MAKKVEFIFDFDSKDVQLASERTLTLAQQVRVLKQELQKTKEGTAEFEILKNKLNETQDQFTRVNAKSRELFGTLSLIPGPIGMIAAKIDGTISLFKTFSGFTFKDLKSQLSALVDDFGSILSNIGKLTGITAIYTKLNEVLAASFVKVGVGEQAAAVGARAFAAALTATGIGAIVVALGFAVSALMDYANAADDAAEKQKELNEQQIAGVKAGEKAVAKFLKSEEEVAILRAKNAGKSENEIQKIREKFANQRIDLAKKTLKGLQDIQGADTTEAADAVADAQNELTKIQLEGESERIKNSQQASEKRKQLSQKEADERKQLAIDDNAARIQIIKDGENTSEKELRAALQKQFELRNQGKKVTEDILRAQNLEIERLVREEIEKDKKAKEEKEKLREEFWDKVRQIQIAGIADENQRAEAQRKDQFEKDKKALQESTEFKKQNTFVQYAILLQLEEAFNNDIAKIRKNATTKEQDDRRKDLNNQLEIVKNQYQFLNRFSEEYFIARAEELKLQQENELIGVEAGSKKALEIEKKYAALRKQLKQEETAAIGQLYSSTIDAFANLGNAIASTYDEEAKTSERAFNQRKQLQKSTALLSAASGIVQILTQPSTLPSPIDWIVKGINAAALGIATSAQISKINATTFQAPGASSTEPRKLASGGLVYGPGGPKDDRVPTLLSNGESVINANSTKMFKPILSAINQMGGGRRFANGGIVSTNYSQQQSLNELNSTLGLNSREPIKTYVVATDMTSQQMFDRAQKSRSTL